MYKIEKQCPMCGDMHTIELTAEQYDKLNSIGKVLIQDLYPELDPATREALKTGYCKECQALMFA